MLFYSTFLSYEILEVHASLSQCWRGSWSQKGWEPLIIKEFVKWNSKNFKSTHDATGHLFCEDWMVNRLACTLTLCTMTAQLPDQHGNKPAHISNSKRFWSLFSHLTCQKTRRRRAYGRVVHFRSYDIRSVPNHGRNGVEHCGHNQDLKKKQIALHSTAQFKRRAMRQTFTSADQGCGVEGKIVWLFNITWMKFGCQTIL